MIHHLEQHVLGLGMLDEECSLAEIVEHQGEEHEVPGPHDRLAAQVPHVRVKRLASRGAENDLGEYEEPGEPVLGHEL